MEQAARFDLRFSKAAFTGEVECKSLSVDAGRRIHRKDFYRFIEAIAPTLEERAMAGAREVIIITLRDRLPADVKNQAELRSAAINCLKQGAPSRVESTFFTIEREPYTKRLAEAPLETGTAFHNACQSAFGENCHVAGPITADIACLIIMRSLKEDDHSKPLLDAMRKAATQFSGTCAGFIAVQFDDIQPTDLVKLNLRRRMGILSYALFLHYGATHVGATYFCIYGGLTKTQVGIVAPAFALPNPEPKFLLDPDLKLPFLNHIPDAEFARLLGRLSRT